ncbi:MAG: phosphohistidine phosphatase SixA [Cyanobacteria bacterium PR.3.49]|nr:phosphohistidine phosphatase SixA [Cyanobacteria bacterium PR.3.49]
MENTGGSSQVEYAVMKIYLMRHATAVERLGGAILNDSQRPLTDDGRAETRMMANALKRLNAKPTMVVSSPLTRARQTAEIILEVLGADCELKIADGLAPGGSSSEVFKNLKKLPPFEDLFLVGHEPDIGRLAADLMLGGPEVIIPFKKAAVIRVDIQDLPPSWPGTLKWFLSPKVASLIGAK